MAGCTARVCCALALSLAWPGGARAQAPGLSSAPPPAALAPAPAASALPDDRAARARDAFSEGLRLVEAKEYRAAQSAFARAYELEPHPLALYNLGQCQARLGQYAAAAHTLQRFLDQGGDTIDAPQRLAVTQQIAELQVRVGANDIEAPAAAAMPEPGSSASAPKPLPPQAPAPSQPIASSGGSHTWGWILGGTGFALLGSAAVLSLWNAGRYSTWKTDRSALEGVSNRDLLVQQDAATWDRTHASNERLASIQRVDVLSAITAGVGAAALGLGIWQLLTGADAGPDAHQQASAAPLAWRWTW